MAGSKQISATLDNDVINDVATMAEEENRSFSQTVETLLIEALLAREEIKAEKKIRNKKVK
jgi:hypothetical protein